MKQYTWDEIYDAARELANYISPDGPSTRILVYGIPRGGWLAAMAVSTHRPDIIHLTDDPTEADWIIDDIMDSGTTLMRYNDEYPGKNLAVIVRHGEHSKDSKLKVFSVLNTDQWVEFPWEAENLVQEAAETIDDHPPVAAGLDPGSVFESR